MAQTSPRASATATSAPTYTLTSSSVLSDDFIWTADVLVNSTNASSIGVFQNDNQPQALFVRADGVLCQLVPTAGQSSAGWAVSTVGTSSGVTQAVAGVQSDGSVHGFYTDAAGTHQIALGTDGVWSAPTTLPACTGLNLTTNFITGELVVYGIDGNGHLLFIRQQAGGGSWSAASLATTTSLAGNRPVLMLTDAACDWVMALPGTAKTGGALALYQGSPTAIQSGPAEVAVPNPVAQVILGYYVNNSVLFLFTDAQHNLYTNVGSTTNVVSIPNVTVANAAAVVDLQNSLHLYVADPSGSVSVLHQTGWDTTTGPIWAPAIPLDSGLQALFTDANPLDAAAFFAIDAEDALWYYQQDPVTQLWGSGKAQMPGGAQSYRVAQYRTELTILDQDTNPANGLAVTVTAATSSAILVGGVLTPIGPSQPVTLNTGSTGRLTISTIASDIGSPALTFTAPGLTTPPPLNPADAVHGYLTGNGTLNAGTSTQLPPFSAQTIQQATVNGAPLAPKTNDPGNGGQLAAAAFSGVQQMFQIQTTGNTVAGRGSVPAVVGFALDFSDPANPTYTPLATQAEYEAHRTQTFFAPGLSASLGSWWDDVKGFFQDVWEGIKNGVIAVTKFVVHVADAVVDLVVQIGDAIHHLVGVVVSGIESVVSAVQGIFAWIGAEIEQLIDWLKMLFDWQDIANTAKALEQALSQSFGYVAGVITNQGEPLVNGFFGKLEGTVTRAFDTVIAQYANGQSLGSLLPSAAFASSPLARQVVSPRFQARQLALAGAAGITPGGFSAWSGNVQNNWLLEKIESFLGNAPTWSAVEDLAQPLNTLETAFQTVVADFQLAIDAFAKFVQTAVTDPKDFGTLGIADLLTAAKEVALGVLSFLDGIIEAFMQVMAIAVQAAGGLITSPLQIPFISALWNSIGDLFGIEMPSLSVSGIFCYALAIPITLLYKIVKGVDQQPFPGGQLPTGDLASDAMASLAGAFAAEDSSGAKEAIKFTAAGIASLWALMDTLLDTVPEVELMVFKILDVVAPTLLQVFTWPGGIPFTTIPLVTSEDKASFANWIVGWAVVVVDVALLTAGAIKWAPQSTIARYIDPTGKILLTAIGGINLISGIVASSLGASGGAVIVGNIIGPLPVLGQFLRLNSLEESSEGVTLAIKLVIDFFAGEGLAVAIAVAE